MNFGRTKVEFPRARRATLARVAVLSILAGAAGVAIASSSFAMWEPLVGQSYGKARKKVIDAGWNLERRKVPSSWEQNLQGQFPELVSCSADVPQCTFHFVSSDGSCLKIVTEGERINDFKVKSVHKQCVGN